MSQPNPNPRPPDDDSLFQGGNWFSRKMVNLISATTPRCTEVTRILSQGMDKPLPLTTRLNLRFHYLMCSFCERYEKQLHYMRKTARSFPECVGDTSIEKLPDDAKERLKRALRDESGGK